MTYVPLQIVEPGSEDYQSLVKFPKFQRALTEDEVHRSDSIPGIDYIANDFLLNFRVSGTKFGNLKLQNRWHHQSCNQSLRY